MSIFKVIKSKVASRLKEDPIANEYRKECDTIQYLKDIQKDYMMAIQVIIITEDEVYKKRGERCGTHKYLETEILGGMPEINTTNKNKGYFPQAIADDNNFVVIEMAPFINGGLSVIYYPQEMNLTQFQIEQVEKFIYEVDRYNEQNDDSKYQANILIKDPETLAGSYDPHFTFDLIKRNNRVK